MARFTILSYEFRTVQDPYDNSLFPTRTDEEKEEILAHKQDYFDEFFKQENFPELFVYSGRHYRVQLLWKYNGIIVFQMEKQGWYNQSIDFQNNKIPDNRWLDIIIDNRAQQQFIAVRKNSTVFKPYTVAKILEENFSNWLTPNYGLEVSVKTQYQSKVFWDIYDKFNKVHGIERLQFNFPFPNKDWISENIEGLMQFGKARNGATRLGLEAAKGEKLYFEKNEDNEKLVNTCSGTGVDVLIKPREHRVIHVVKEMNPIEHEISDGALQKVLRPTADTPVEDEIVFTAYQKAGEFLNKFKQYYE